MACSLRNLIAFLLLGLGCRPLPAQHDNRPIAATPTVRLTFRTFALEPIAGLHYRPRPGAALTPIAFYSSARSRVYRYEGPPRLVFYAGTDTPSPVATTDAETITASRALLLFRPAAPMDQPRYEIIAVSDDLERLPSGSAVIVNLSGRPYRASLNQRSLEVPASITVSAPVPIREVTSLQLSAPMSDGWRRVSAVDLEFAERARVWIILFPPYRRGELQPQLRVLCDLPDPASESGGADG